jgi:hypothetical protein
MDEYTHILTGKLKHPTTLISLILNNAFCRLLGYIGNAATLETCVKAIREIKERRKDVIYGKLLGAYN